MLEQLGFGELRVAYEVIDEWVHGPPPEPAIERALVRRVLHTENDAKATCAEPQQRGSIAQGRQEVGDEDVRRADPPGFLQQVGADSTCFPRHLRDLHWREAAPGDRVPVRTHRPRRTDLVGHWCDTEILPAVD